MIGGLSNPSANCFDPDVLFVIKSVFGFTFILSHYPMLIHNFKDDKPLWNLHGHTHSPDKFSEFYHCYNVALDAHNNKPVELDEIINDIKGVYNEGSNINN